MNVIVLYGSPHPCGNCSGLLRAFMNGAREGGHADFEIFDTYALRAEPCYDCGACRDADTCVHGDLDRLDAALRQCGAMVIASPVYHATFPAPLKAVFDRAQRYFYAWKQGRTPFGGEPRPAYLLLSAGQRAETGEVIKNQLRWILPPLNMRLAGTVIASGTDRATVTSAALGQARALGEECAAACRGLVNNE